MDQLAAPKVATLASSHIRVDVYNDLDGCWCSQELAPKCLDCPILGEDEEFGDLLTTRYGDAIDEVPPRLLPETGGKCFVSWAADVADGWDQFTPEQRNTAFVIAFQVYPDGNLFAEIEQRH